MAERFNHTIDNDPVKSYASLPDNYQNIGSIVGVTRLQAGDPVGTISDVEDLLEWGSAVRLSVRVDEGTEKKTYRVLCARDKITTAISGLIGEQYKGGEITAVSIPRRRRLK